MEDNDVCNSWEDMDPTVLEKQLERINLEKSKRDQTDEAQNIKILSRQQGDTDIRVQLDDTLLESLRSQYVPPEPKISILSRPKASSGVSNTHHLNGHCSNKNKPVKTLQQREQEYAEARMRILGDVKFEDSDDCEPDGPEQDTEPSEAEAEETEPTTEPTAPTEPAESTESAYAGLTPAEILKQKIAQVLLEDSPSGSIGASSETSNLPTSKNASTSPSVTTAPATKSKKSKREKIKTTNPEPTRDFPVSKTDMERIIRQPRGPDGTSGFNFPR